MSVGRAADGSHYDHSVILLGS